MNFAEALAELDSRQPERMVPNLDRVTALARMLGDPQVTYPTIHVTGTNGKTTTARIVTGLACAHGLQTGTYTSPHLESVTERISVCDTRISDDEFAEEYTRLLPFLAEIDAMSEERVTYFEVLTALAYLWFSDKPVALGVFEVGMGGSWDATNLVAGDVAVLCPVSFDHPELGSTLIEKATEKAGIIKEGKVAVCREQPGAALSVIETRAHEMKTHLLLEERDWALEDRAPGVGGQVVTIRGLHATYEDVELSLFGEHAARNAACAVVALEAVMDRPLDDDALRGAFASAASPGRLEVAARHPLVILDGAHNPAGAQALAEALEESFSWDRLLLVLSISADKDAEAIVDTLAPLTTQAFATQYGGVRARKAGDLARMCEEAGIATTTAGSVTEALASALALAGETDLILVTGSLYTVADARRVLNA